MPPQPSDWSAQNETDYQAELAKLKAQIAAAGPNDDIAVIQEALAAMSDPQQGRLYYLKAKANGWL